MSIPLLKILFYIFVKERKFEIVKFYKQLFLKNNNLLNKFFSNF